ncbi:MAG TPA: hypothetical protein VJS44_17980 [Pyrinomonadaceae bacterium]|nr:hypothetical protein [Pyrinomonadaceae bacterium]
MQSDELKKNYSSLNLLFIHHFAFCLLHSLSISFIKTEPDATDYKLHPAEVKTGLSGARACESYLRPSACGIRAGRR